MRGAVVLSALMLAACAPPPSVDLTPGQSLGPERFRRLAVARFADARGEGRAIAEGVAGRLARLDYSCVDPGQLEIVLAGLRRDPNDELTPEQLARIRRQTLADGLLLGEVSTTRRSAGVTLLDAATGEVILTARVRPREETFASADEIADAVAAVFARRRERPRAATRPGIEALPDPQ